MAAVCLHIFTDKISVIA